GGADEDVVLGVRVAGREARRGRGEGDDRAVDRGRRVGAPARALGTGVRDRDAGRDTRGEDPEEDVLPGVRVAGDEVGRIRLEGDPRAVGRDGRVVAGVVRLDPGRVERDAAGRLRHPGRVED